MFVFYHILFTINNLLVACLNFARGGFIFWLVSHSLSLAKSSCVLCHIESKMKIVYILSYLTESYVAHGCLILQFMFFKLNACAYVHNLYISMFSSNAFYLMVSVWIMNIHFRYRTEDWSTTHTHDKNIKKKNVHKINKTWSNSMIITNREKRK